MNFEELDDKTRGYMITAFDEEAARADSYTSKALSAKGLASFPALMRTAISAGDDDTLFRSLDDSSLWDPLETYHVKGVAKQRQRNISQTATRLAVTEFSTWYVRGFAKRLLDEGVEKCQIYRGASPKWEPGECAAHDGEIVDVKMIYENHRKRYWPTPGDQNLMSIPFGPGCHHLIRRVTEIA